MKQFVIDLTDSAQVEYKLEIAQKAAMHKDVSAVLVHVFMGLQVHVMQQEVLSRIRKTFPTAFICGLTSGGEIKKGRMISPSVLIRVSIFTCTSIGMHAFQIQPGEESKKGRQIASLIDATPSCQGAELLIDSWNLSVPDLLPAINTCSQKVKLFGYAPFRIKNLKPKFVFTADPGEACNVIVITYSGKDFHLATDYVTGWKPLGTPMRATRASGKMLYELDHKPAFDIYSRYLKIPNDKHFYDNIQEFPLLVYTHDTYILRVPFACKENGALEMISAVEEGQNLYLSYGDPDFMLSDVFECRRGLQTFHPQTISICSCTVRQAFWGDCVDNELLPFQELAPASGLFTGGEYLRVNGELFHFNATMVIAAFREKEPSSLTETMNFKIKRTRDLRKIVMISRLVNFINVAMQELKAANAELQRQAITDELTRLYNRRGIRSRIRQQLDSAQKFSLVLFDIDYFKRVNDTFGHEVGDLVLKEMAGILLQEESSYQNPDLSSGRWGGEEFLVLLPNEGKESAAKFAESLRKHVERFHFTTAGHITISAGVAEMDQSHDHKWFYKAVDDALYAAKSAGRNCVKLSTPDE